MNALSLGDEKDIKEWIYLNDDEGDLWRKLRNEAPTFFLPISNICIEERLEEAERVQGEGLTSDEIRAIYSAYPYAPEFFEDECRNHWDKESWDRAFAAHHASELIEDDHTNEWLTYEAECDQNTDWA